jgi:hypothetical protein
MREATIGSWSYFDGNQPQKVIAPCSMRSTRLSCSNIKVFFLGDHFFEWSSSFQNS